MDLSQLKIYSLGIVAEDKPTETYTITVMPIEHITEAKGSITEEQEYTSDAVDHKGRAHKNQTTSKNTLKAKWIALGSSNRVSAPDVIKGETVLLFKFGDAEEFYWTDLGQEPGIRRLEKVLYSYSNMSTGERTESFDRSTSYWVEYDTLNKRISLHTSDNDSEVTTYDIVIDTAEGTLTVEDGLGNALKLNSPEGILDISTNQEINLVSQNISLKADTITLDARDISMSADTVLLNSDRTTIHAASELVLRTRHLIHRVDDTSSSGY